MKKMFSVMGIIIGLSIIVLGLYLAFGTSYDLRGHYSGKSTTGYTFGADYYTEQYSATKNASDNIKELGEYTWTAMRSQTEIFGAFAKTIGIFISLLGGAVTCYFGCKLGDADSKNVQTPAVMMREETLEQIGSELPEI